MNRQPLPVIALNGVVVGQARTFHQATKILKASASFEKRNGVWCWTPAKR